MDSRRHLKIRREGSIFCKHRICKANRERKSALRVRLCRSNECMAGVPATVRIVSSQEQQHLLGSPRLEGTIDTASSEQGSESRCASSFRRENPVAICTPPI